MSPEELRQARRTLGFRWGYGRPLHASEMGRALGLHGRDPGRSVRRYEEEVRSIPPHVLVTLKSYLAGATPPEFTGVEVYRKAGE